MAVTENMADANTILINRRFIIAHTPYLNEIPMKEGSTLECETPPWYVPLSTCAGRKRASTRHLPWLTP
jgi:hypothetical protein